MSLHASYWDYLLRLLGLMVVVNGKVYHEEVEAFTQAAKQLQRVISPNMIMTENMALEWFVSHRKRLQMVVDRRDCDSAIIQITSHLRSLPQKVEVIKAMITIALSDNDYHASEKMIIKKTIVYWNIDPSEIEQ